MSHSYRSQKTKEIKNFQKHKITAQSLIIPTSLGFPGGTVIKNPPANAGDTGLSPSPGRSHMPRSN